MKSNKTLKIECREKGLKEKSIEVVTIPEIGYMVTFVRHLDNQHTMCDTVFLKTEEELNNLKEVIGWNDYEETMNETLDVFLPDDKFHISTYEKEDMSIEVITNTEETRMSYYDNDTGDTGKTIIKYNEEQGIYLIKNISSLNDEYSNMTIDLEDIFVKEIIERDNVLHSSYRDVLTRNIHPDNIEEYKKNSLVNRYKESILEKVSSIHKYEYYYTNNIKIDVHHLPFLMSPRKVLFEANIRNKDTKERINITKENGYNYEVKIYDENNKVKNKIFVYPFKNVNKRGFEYLFNELGKGIHVSFDKDDMLYLMSVIKKSERLINEEHLSFDDDSFYPRTNIGAIYLYIDGEEKEGYMFV